MSAFITEIEKTSIRKNHYGWCGETYMKINGLSYEITTMKRHNGEIASIAQKLRTNKEENGMRVVSFMMFADKSIVILRERSNATEAKVKELHYKALALIDTMPDQFPNAPAYKVEVGQLFFMDGYGKEDEKLAIYSIDQDNDRVWYVNTKTLRLNNNEFSHIRPWSEKFGIGYYYQEGETMDLDELSNMVIEARVKAELEEAGRPAKEAAEKAEIDRQKAEIEAQYPYLQRPSSQSGGGKNVAVNLRIELKRTFPNVKFSVVSEYSRVEVTWTDGPTTDQIKEITDKWEDHKTDYSGDYRDYAPSLFNNVFGGCNYMSESRKMSGATEAKINAVLDVQLVEFDPNIPWRIFCENEIPTQEWEIIPKPNFRGPTYEAYEIKPVVQTPVPEIAETVAHEFRPTLVGGGILVTRNIDKNGIEIRFPTKPTELVINELKAHGFRWSGFGKCWWARYSGSLWDFANSIK